MTTTTLSAPLADAINSDLAAALAAEAALGTLRIGTRADGLTVPAGWATATDEASSARLWDRAGRARGTAGEFRVDYGSALGQALLTDTLYRALARDWSFAGFDLGGMLGGQGERGYDPPATTRGHYPHGGAYRTAGVRASIQRLTAEVATHDLASFVVGDAAQEYVLGDVDLLGEGEQLLPNQAELAAETFQALGVSDVDPVSRDLTPALWAGAYGERSQTGRRVMPFTTAPLATSIFHPHLGSAKWPGLTSAEWNQLLCYSLACVAISGHVPVLEMPMEFYAHRVLPDSQEPCVRFLDQVFRALRDTDWCAQFLAFGRAELPLTHAEPRIGAYGMLLISDSGGATSATSSRAVATNPFSWVKKIAPSIVQQVGPPGLPVYRGHGAWSDGFSDGWSHGPETPATGHGAMHQAFDVPAVLASFWRDRTTTDLGLVLMNWTSAPAAWEGRFTSRRYADWGSGRFSDGFSDGWATGPRYRVDSLPGPTRSWSDGFSDGWGRTSEPITLATGLSVTTRLDFSGTAGAVSGSTLFCGPMPAYSVRCYRIRQES